MPLMGRYAQPVHWSSARRHVCTYLEGRVLPLDQQQLGGLGGLGFGHNDRVNRHSGTGVSVFGMSRRL